MDTCNKIANSIAEMKDTDELLNLIEEAINEGISPSVIIGEGIRKGLEAVGRRYEEGTYFLSELMFAGDLVNESMNALKPHMGKEDTSAKGRGKLILGTVEGDIHDIGKNIFKILAVASGFEVIDLGVDVDPQTFIEKTRESNARIVAMSALLTTTREKMKEVINDLKKAGLREKVKVILGGNAVTEKFGQSIGADAVARDAYDGVKKCDNWAD